MRRHALGALIAALALSGSTVAAAPTLSAAEPTDAGVMSPNVEHITTIPVERGTATGARIVGDRLFLTSWRSMSIYDISDPLEPKQLSQVNLGFQFENEDVSTDGKILLFSEQAPVDRLHVWDVSDGANPHEIATLDGAGTHTATCVLDCTWAYGSYDFVGPDGAMTGGQLVDLRNPAAPADAGHYNTDLPAKQTHDVFEVAPGRVLTASKPIQYLDIREDPAKPRLLAVGTNDDRRMHTARWPRGGKDRFIMTTFETNADVRCTETSGEFSTWSTRKWRKTGEFTVIDQYRVANGSYLDGRPAANQLGCSAHWFEEHPTFRNGGLVAAGFYEHGVRFLDISRNGEISEVGYFMGWSGSTSAAYWATDDIVYAIDYSRGIDVLRFDREAPTETTEDVDASTWARLGAAAAAAKPDGFVCRIGA